ncbi:MAG: hypothetical protein E7K47_10220, partial [Acidovorax sp.]|nr:hypothetical protein [Acidovorax sp.]
PQAVLELGLDGLEGYIKTIGLYRTKAKNLMQTCRILVEQHGGQQLEYVGVFQLGVGLRVGGLQRREEGLDVLGLHGRRLSPAVGRAAGKLRGNWRQWGLPSFTHPPDCRPCRLPLPTA